MAKSRRQRGGPHRSPNISEERKCRAPQPSTERFVGQHDGIRVFLSYSRTDDEAFDVIRPFKNLLSTFVHAKSGQRIATFLDQEDIEWGETWRTRLQTEILRASVFIPILSANYLQSQNCRDEFNLFSAAASDLGVNELLLPIMLLDAPAVFSETSTDDIVQAVLSRQYERLQDAVLSHPGSAEWKLTMSHLADRFTSAHEAAEAVLLTLKPADIHTNRDSSAEDALSDDQPDDDAPALAELSEQLQADMDEMGSVAMQLGPAIEALGNATTSVAQLRDDPTPKEVQAWSFRAATAIKDPSETLSALGEKLLQATRRTDATVVGMKHIALELPEFRDTYIDMIGELDNLGDVKDSLGDLLESMKPIEYISIPLRQAIRPARRGLVRVTDALAIIDTWKIGS